MAVEDTKRDGENPSGEESFQDTPETGSADSDVLEFKPEEGNVGAATSDSVLRSADIFAAAEMVKEESLSEPEGVEMQDPVFRELAEPKLPQLEKENRAKLLMQSPNRLYFYWSVGSNPFQTLSRALGGDTGSYRLVAKLVNLSRDAEELYPVEAEGNWWFDVEADSNYRAEIGFYAPNRPYVRIMFSNSVQTPRKSPSPRQATDADWAVSAGAFATVLNAAGFRHDAFEVAMTGDDVEHAEVASRSAFARFTEIERRDFVEIDAAELRFALLAIASGVLLKDLRAHISPALFALLQANSDRLTVENALAALEEYFDIFTDEVIEEEETGAAVYGASLIHFPKGARKRAVPKKQFRKIPSGFESKIEPISSFSIG